uniref:Solute carrier family 25 member 48 n=1 Tax=Saimiri boliviensis boliviensis TaxID=39432 RepID=A0A2K6UU69_SAIBB
MGSFQLEDFAAGWIGGAASVIVGHPLDTVKTRLQAGVGYGNTLSCIRTEAASELLPWALSPLFFLQLESLT